MFFVSLKFFWKRARRAAKLRGTEDQMMRRIFHSSLVAAFLIFCPLVSHGQSGLKETYQRWLKEDVAYIITPNEQRAFLKLNTDEEREQFIEAFWRRRDPVPGTEKNEYRDEYYERIAYANESFAFGNVTGWRTDRGRTYILYGAPDEKQKTASGEIWKYRFIPGQGAGIEFEFVDVSGTGNLRLKGQP
jgi:GWxTD domain-containing protein